MVWLDCSSPALPSQHLVFPCVCSEGEAQQHDPLGCDAVEEAGNDALALVELKDLAGGVAAGRARS